MRRLATGIGLSALLCSAVTVVMGVLSDGQPAVAVSNACGIAVVANYKGGTVSMIDVATRTVTGHPTSGSGTGSGAAAVAITPDGSTAVVVNYHDGTVSTFDLATRTKTGSDIPVGADSLSQPQGVAITPDGKTAYSANYEGSVSTIDLATRTKTGSDITDASAPVAVAITPDGKTAFVTNYNGNTVSTIDVATRVATGADIPVLSNPIGVAITPDGTTVFVSNHGTNKVSVIDVATRTKTADITVGSNPFGLAITPDGKTLFVANNGGTTVSTIDVATQTVTGSPVTVGSNPSGVAITPDGRTAFVANYNDDSVSTIDVATRTVTGSPIAVDSGPFGMGIAPCQQAITFTSSPTSPAFGGTYGVSATGGGSGNPVLFSSGSPAVCTVSGSAVVFVGVGTCIVDANQAGGGDYLGAPQVQQSIPVGKAATSISTHSTVVTHLSMGTVTFSATLTSQVTGQRLAGQTIGFRLNGLGAILLNVLFGGGTSCMSTTNSSGVATCTLPAASLGLLFVSSGYTATFAGTANYQASSATATINVLGALL